MGRLRTSGQPNIPTRPYFSSIANSSTRTRMESSGLQIPTVAFARWALTFWSALLPCLSFTPVWRTSRVRPCSLIYSSVCISKTYTRQSMEVTPVLTTRKEDLSLRGNHRTAHAVYLHRLLGLLTLTLTDLKTSSPNMETVKMAWPRRISGMVLRPNVSLWTSMVGRLVPWNVSNDRIPRYSTYVTGLTHVISWQGSSRIYYCGQKTALSERKTSGKYTMVASSTKWLQRERLQRKPLEFHAWLASVTIWNESRCQ